MTYRGSALIDSWLKKVRHKYDPFPIHHIRVQSIRIKWLSEVRWVSLNVLLPSLHVPLVVVRPSSYWCPYVGFIKKKQTQWTPLCWWRTDINAPNAVCGSIHSKTIKGFFLSLLSWNHSMQLPYMCHENMSVKAFVRRSKPRRESKNLETANSNWNGPSRSLHTGCWISKSILSGLLWICNPVWKYLTGNRTTTPHRMHL